MAVALLIDETQIRERLAALGRQIEDDYRDRPLTIVAVLYHLLLIRQNRESLDFPTSDYRAGGKFDGFVLEAVVGF